MGYMERRNVVQEKSCSVAKQVVELVRVFPRRMDGFVVGNQFLRSDTPPCFLVEPKIAEIPQGLLQLDWECDAQRAGEKV